MDGCCELAARHTRAGKLKLLKLKRAKPHRLILDAVVVAATQIDRVPTPPARKKRREAVSTEHIMEADAPRCTKSLFGDREVCQPRFQVGDVAVCEACATFAVPEGLGEPVVTTPLKPFACGIATLAASGLCADVFHATALDGCAPIDGEAALRKAIDQQRTAPAPNAPSDASPSSRALLSGCCASGAWRGSIEDSSRFCAAVV